MRTLVSLQLIIALLLLQLALPSFSAPADNVILVTADGLRWQEVFRGADDRLLGDEKFTPKDWKGFRGHQSAGIKTARRQLMPFFWDVLVAHGSVVGDRDNGSLMRV